jgi:type I restriction-modification system DNA methylase subunit
LTLKYDNPYELNKAIELLLDQKNSTNPDDYTLDEKRFIGLYSGMGGLAKHGAKGAGLLWEYFTPDPIVQKMWGLAYKHGFNGGEVTEPASGIGAFIKYANSECRVTGYEINKYSFTICKILFPHAKMLNEPFENRFLKNNNTVKGNVEFDEMRPKAALVIGNPPYGDFASRGAGMGERDYTHATKYIEYFITRGLDLLEVGGLLIYIIGVEVANGGIPFLQQGMTKAKEEIIAKSELLEAYRLPNGVFERTDVVTDIIVLRKK